MRHVLQAQFVRVALLLLVVLLRTTSSYAHAMQTAYLEITEVTTGVASATWKMPVAGRDAAPSIEGCSTEESPELNADGNMSRFVHHLTLRCPGTLAGRQVAVAGLGIEVSEVVARIALVDGSVASQVLSPSHPKWTIPAKQGFLDVFPRYVRFGVEHILRGADHLLFVLGLVLLIGATHRREIVWTATSFTAAHSITLTATALGWLHIPSAAAEACIAGTLVLLALDIGQRSEPSRAKRPRIMAFVFGLVHGLGFAGALSEIGLPKGAVTSALFAFNVGVEIGQLLFIVAILLALAGLERLTKRWPASSRWPATSGAYAIGGLGTFWLIQRWELLLAS